MLISSQKHNSIQSHLPISQFSLHRFPQVMHYFHQPPRSSKSKVKSHLVESSHRLISTPNLHLEEGRFVPITSFFRALHLCLICIVPSSRSAEDIFSLFPCKDFPLVVSLLEDVLVGASLAFQTVYGFM